MAKQNKKKQERKLTAREKHKNDKNTKSEENDSTDDPDLEKQLDRINLKLRDVNGDGNCLFRAISDQMTGKESNHRKFRRDAVDYVKNNKDNFAPFIEDDWDKFLSTLGQDGEFAGNEAIVALAKFHRVEIIIHQANQAVWNIDGATEQSTGQKRQLHIAYHDWEHYSSVRPKKDFSKEPAWLRISDDQSDRSKNDSQTDLSKYEEQTESQENESPVVTEEFAEQSGSKPKKPLSGKEKKRLRKEKASKRKRDAIKGNVSPQLEEYNSAEPLSLNLEQLKI